MTKPTNVCVIGMGYIGLPTALMLADHGANVTGVDRNAGLIARLQNGELTFDEDSMDVLFNRTFQTSIQFTGACVPAEVYIITVPTPYEPDSKRVDPSYVVSAVRAVLDVCPDRAVLVIESTVSPGTIDQYVRPIFDEKNKKAGRDVHIAHAPERIFPGRMIWELEHNPRTIGADDPRIGERIKALYQTFCKAEIVVTDIRTAEMTKVVENTFRDINIAFANELCKICREENLDVYEIIRIANMHPRVHILQPGPGVGGHCISVDPWFLVGDHPDLSLLIHQARDVNNSMPGFVLSRLREIMAGHSLAGLSRVGIYGLTYKEDVDDVRESPTLQLLAQIPDQPGQRPKVFDPMVKRDLVPGQYHDFDAFLKDIDLIVIMVAHSHIRDHMDDLKGKLVLDTRHVCPLEGVYPL